MRPFKSKIEKLTEKANMGDPVAQNKLGLAYEFGNGVQESEQKAEFWYKKACKQGNLDAYYNLGVLYGARKDFQKAEDYLRYASERGHSRAKITLGGFVEIKDVGNKMKSQLFD